MKFTTALIFYICLMPFAKGQNSTVFYLNHPNPGTEETPLVKPLSNGDFLLTGFARRSNPDSLYPVITRLNSNFEPIWSRVIKIRRSNTAEAAVEEPNGNIRIMVTSHTVTTLYKHTFLRLSAQGDLLESGELLDSSSTTQAGPFYKHIRMSDGTTLLMPYGFGTAIVAINPQGQVVWAKQPNFKNGGINPYLVVQNAIPLSEAGRWIATGYVNNTGLAFFAQMRDSVALDFHVYRPDASSNSHPQVGQLHRYPNGEVLVIWQINGRGLHLIRLTASGNIIWRKSYKSTNSFNLGTLMVDPNGDIWLAGSTQPLVAGLMAHFSPAGELIDLKGQFGNAPNGYISAIGRLPSNEMFTFQKGYYLNQECFVGNKLGATTSFLCFNTILYNLTLVDTSWAMVDSSSTSIYNITRRFSFGTTLSAPVLFSSRTATIGPVVCTPNAVSIEEKTDRRVAFPNPATGRLNISSLSNGTLIRIFGIDGRQVITAGYEDGIDVQQLPNGLYEVQIADQPNRFRFVKQ